jgi:hydrogenase expression/formation protein HypE
VASPFGECPLPVAGREQVLLGHGSGGTLTAQLLQDVILPAFTNPALDRLDDQAVLDRPPGRLAFTTDSYVVTPLFFPGGDIGQLAVHGTVNDLAMGGARPLALSVGFILEEGLPIETLRRVVASIAAAARAAGVPIVTGDTKVVGRGAADQLFLNTSGIGVVPDGVALTAGSVRPGDAVLLSGTVGDHGMAIMAARGALGLEGDLRSDTAALHGLVAALLAACPDARALRDPTRGGVATTLHEIAAHAAVGIRIRDDAVPVKDEVRGACEILGLDPLFVANEGKLVAFVPETAADRALSALRAHPLGRGAARIGSVTEAPRGLVVVETALGSTRVLERPYGELLPRIC